MIGRLQRFFDAIARGRRSGRVAPKSESLRMWLGQIAFALIIVASARGEGAHLADLYSSGTKLPRYQGNRPEVIISEVEVVRCPSELIFSTDPTEGGFDRQNSTLAYRRLSSDEKAHLLRESYSAKPSKRATLQPEGFFSLWRTGSWNGAPAIRQTALASFEFVVQQEGVWALAVGCDYSFAAVVNGAVVGGRCGYGPYARNSDLIECHLKAGLNVVQVAFVVNVPQDGELDPRWCASIEMLAEAGFAARLSDQNSAHPFICPIVQTPGNLRTRLGFPFTRTVQLLDLNRNPIANGAVDKDGKIQWVNEPKLSGIAAIGIVDGRMAEPIFFGNPQALSAIEKHDSGIEQAAWLVRYNHLMEEQYRNDRISLEWAQKVAFYRALCEVPASFPLPQISGPALLLGSFRSSIDNAVQYYQYHLPANWKSSKQPKRILVIVPGATDPIRPFLEGTTVAGFSEWERWANVADQYNCALLWPGYNDVDYGGEYALQSLRETITKFREQIREEAEIYLFGACSAGVTATRYAGLEGNDLGGLILLSPELLRRVQRNTPGLESDILTKPLETDEAGVQLQWCEAIRDQRVGVLFDSGMPGHGDRETTDAMVRKLRAGGHEVHEFEAPETKQYLWGERMVWRLNQFMEWIEQQAPVHHSTVIKEKTSDPLTLGSLKKSLLRGFSVDAKSLQLKWFATWERQYLVWRESRLPRDNPNAKTVVRHIRIGDPHAFESLVEMGISKELLARPFFAIFTRTQGSRTEVVIATGDEAQSYYPKMDPILDGNCIGVFWTLEDGVWDEVKRW